MSFLQNQVTNFKNQYNRIVSFNKTINSKLNKSGEFSNASSYLLAALGNTSVYSNVQFTSFTSTCFGLFKVGMRATSAAETRPTTPAAPPPPWRPTPCSTTAAPRYTGISQKIFAKNICFLCVQITASCSMPSTLVPSDVVSNWEGFCHEQFEEANTLAEGGGRLYPKKYLH